MIATIFERILTHEPEDASFFVLSPIRDTEKDFNPGELRSMFRGKFRGNYS